MRSLVFASLLCLGACSQSDVGVDKTDLKLKESAGSVSFDGFISLDNGEQMKVSGSVEIPPTSGGLVKEQDIVITNARSDAVWALNPNPWIGHRRISDLKVTANGRTLQEGKDYFADRDFGKLMGADYTGAVSASYHYTQERYDLVYATLEDGSVGVRHGATRDIDASDYIPPLKEGEFAIATIYVVGDKRTVVPVYRFVDGRPTSGGPGSQAEKAHNDASLRRVKALLADGDPVKIASYGDSITAFGSGRGTYTANGPVRDIGSSMEAMQPDTRERWDYFDFDDGAGKVHVKKSYVWTFIHNMEARYGSEIEYLNFGGSSTHSGTGDQQGLWPERLEPVLATKANLMILAFGMNEIGSKETQKNVAEIIRRAKGAGMEVVVMAVTKPNPVANPMSKGAWDYTNAALKAAAYEAGAAFCDTTILTDGAGGGIPLAPESLSAANFFNHPGPIEHRAYGQVLTRLF
ncbi:SGNH/GDSL hydrolase family protein [Pseudomonas sp. S31]|nr:SGNH/GDSL hydrolase family protein [Pseudomonas sp. S31]